MHNFKEEKESNMHLVGGLIRTSSHESCMGLGFRDLGFSLVANIYIYIYCLVTFQLGGLLSRALPIVKQKREGNIIINL